MFTTNIEVTKNTWVTSSKPPLCKFTGASQQKNYRLKSRSCRIRPDVTRNEPIGTSSNAFRDSFKFRYRDLGIIRDISTLFKLYLQVLLINKTLTKALPCKKRIRPHHLCKFTVSPFGNKYGVAYPREANAFDVSTQYSSSLTAASQSGSAMTFLIDRTSGTEYSIKQSKSAKSQAGRYFPRSSFMALFNVGGVTN